MQRVLLQQSEPSSHSRDWCHLPVLNLVDIHFGPLVTQVYCIDPPNTTRVIGMPQEVASIPIVGAGKAVGRRGTEHVAEDDMYERRVDA